MKMCLLRQTRRLGRACERAARLRPLGLGAGAVLSPLMYCYAIHERGEQVQRLDGLIAASLLLTALARGMRPPHHIVIGPDL